jgi:predicted membrane protein
MPFAALLIGAILIVVAFNNSFAALASELEADVPAYFKWAAAIAAILGLGYVPGLRTPSRYLLGLVLMVILLKNYSQIFSGFQTFLTSSGTASATGAGAANPSASYTSAYAPAAASTTGATTAATTPATQIAGASQALTAAQALAANPLNPNAYTNLISGFGAAV